MFSLLVAFSLHFSPVEYNYLHPHIRYSENSIVIGAYYNSIENVSLYAGFRNGDKYWIEYGAVTGYKYAVVPMVRAGVRITDNINLFAAPHHDDHGFSGLIGVEFNI